MRLRNGGCQMTQSPFADHDDTSKALNIGPHNRRYFCVMPTPQQSIAHLSKYSNVIRRLQPTLTLPYQGRRSWISTESGIHFKTQEFLVVHPTLYRSHLSSRPRPQELPSSSAFLSIGSQQLIPMHLGIKLSPSHDHATVFA
jgi:hypothetical protein